MDPLVLSLQGGTETAVFVSSTRHRDFVAEAGKCGSRSLGLILVLWPSICCTAPQAMSSTRMYEHLSKKIYDASFLLSSSTTLKQCFAHIPLLFEARLKPIVALESLTRVTKSYVLALGTTQIK